MGLRFLFVGLLGAGAQSRFAGSVVHGFAGEHDAAQASLDGIEFGRSDDIFLPRGKNASNFFLGVLDAILGWRMGRKRFADGAGAALFVSLNALEESHVGVRIVAGLVHILQAEEISFAFGVAGKFQESHGNQEVHALVDSVTGPAVGKHDHRGNRGDLDDVALSGLLGAVARGDVGDFVGHDAGEFRLFIGAKNQAAVDVEKSARKREGVDFVGVNDLDGEGNFCVGIAHEILADAIDVFGDDGVVDKFGGAFDFLGELLAETDFVFDGVEINTLTDAAVANGLDVFLGILGGDGVRRSDGSLLTGLGLGLVRRWGSGLLLGRRVDVRLLAGRRLAGGILGLSESGSGEE